MKNFKKYYKLIVFILVILIISILGVLIYKNLFQSSDSTRLDGIENYELTNEEINLVKEKFNELEGISKIDITTNYKIIKIFIEFNNDVDFQELDEISNESIELFSKNNLKFYDIEIFVETLNSEGTKQSRIGYKHKLNSEFTWNRWLDE